MDFTNPGNLLLGGGIIAVVAAGWNYVKGLLNWLRSFVLISADTQGGLPDAVLAYMRHKYRVSRFGSRTFVSWRLFVRPLFRREWVAMESVGAETKLFWRGWLPIWVGRSSDNSSQQDQTSFLYKPIKLTFFRGTLNIDELITEANNFYNNVAHDVTDGTRYRIVYVHGSGSKPAQVSLMGSSGPGMDSPVAVEDDDLKRARGNRLLRWEFNQLGPDRQTDGKALQRLWLEPVMKDVAAQITDWLSSRDWHRERGVPWKRGYGLYGPPGTGKTSFVRAIAEDHDLPVFVYDLATLHNDEMRKAWSDMLSATPCIALIEDVDAVFNGRETLKDKHLTFDCMLNCLDGVEKSDGLLTFVTSNNPEKLDPALGGGGSSRSSRPGRVDEIVFLNADLGDPGRRYVANRVLRDLTDQEREYIINSGVGDTGAQFERRCIEAAARHRWSRS